MNSTIIKKYNFFKDYNFIYLIFLSFCLGSFFINLSTFVCLIIFVIRYKIIKIYINQFKFLFNSLLFFWIIFLISTIINDPSNINLIFKSFAYVRFIILSFVIIYMMNKIDKKKFIIFINLIIITLILDIFFQFYFKIDFFGYRLEELGNPNMDRISGFFGNELIAGTYLSLFGFLTLFLTKAFNFFVKNNYVFFIYLILLISAAIITGDRVVILLIFGIIFFNFIFNYHMRKYFLIIFLIFGLIGTIIIKNVDKLSDRYIDNFDPVIETKISTSSSLKGIINSPWVSHYLVSWEMIKEKPFLGFGNRGFRTYCNQYIDREKLSSYKKKCTSHPHNTYFEILVETGTIGLVIFILINLNILIKVLKKKDQTIYLVYSIIFTILNPLRPSGSFFTTWNSGIFWTILGILLYFIIYNKNYIKNQSDNRHL